MSIVTDCFCDISFGRTALARVWQTDRQTDRRTNRTTDRVTVTSCCNSPHAAEISKQLWVDAVSSKLREFTELQPSFADLLTFCQRCYLTPNDFCSPLDVSTRRTIFHKYEKSCQDPRLSLSICFIFSFGYCLHDSAVHYVAFSVDHFCMIPVTDIVERDGVVRHCLNVNKSVKKLKCNFINSCIVH